MINMNKNIFREYDIRGIAEKDLNPEFLKSFSRALGTYFLSRSVKKISLGRDCRLSSPVIHRELISGLLSTGIEVVDIGLVSTPMLYFSLFHLEVDGGVMITGSHNPGEYNGFKVAVGKSTLHGDEIQKILQAVERGSWSQGEGRYSQVSIETPYFHAIQQSIGEKIGPLKVVVDSGNGMASGTAAQIYSELGCEVIDLFPDYNGLFPNHHPDPTVPENLKALLEAVKKNNADVGIAFDGDADRIGVVDPSGKILYGDELLILCARDLLKVHPGAKVITEVKASRRFFEDIAQKGGTPILWKTGHSLIKEKMKSEKALLGGEMSGHMFFSDRWFGFDDAIYAGARVLQILHHQKQTVAELLSDLPSTHCTPEIRVDCPDDIKFQVVSDAVKEFKSREINVIDLDGARVEFPDGWGLVRASNTQPVLVFRYEASSHERLSKIRELVEGVVDQAKCKLKEKSSLEGPKSTTSRISH